MLNLIVHENAFLFLFYFIKNLNYSFKILLHTKLTYRLYWSFRSCVTFSMN